MGRQKGPNKTLVPFEGSEDPRSMAALIAHYFEWMRIRGYSETTITRAWEVLGMFLKWCKERSLSQARDITKPMLERYQRHLYHYRKRNGEPLSFRGQHGQLCAIQSLFRFLAKQNYILYNPASDLELPKVGKRLPRFVLSVSEVEQVLNVADIGNDKGIRDRAIMETLYSTGIRRSELINLKLYDIDDDREIMTIREGKGRRDRMIPIGERALSWIRKYLDDVRPSLMMEPDNGILFLTLEGGSMSQGHLTKLVRTYIKASKIGKIGSCHIFRHTMATLMLEGGADIRFIQQMLGHAELASTEIYTHVSLKRLKEIYLATHPGAKLERKKKRETPEEETEKTT